MIFWGSENKIQILESKANPVCVRRARFLPQARQVPDLDDAVLADRQYSLLLLVDVDVDHRVLRVQEGGERGTIGVLKRGVACVADSYVVLKAHDWNVDSIW